MVKAATLSPRGSYSAVERKETLVNRREFVKTSALGLATSGVAAAGRAEATKPERKEGRTVEKKTEQQQLNLAATCGLFCGSCGDMKEGRCHGCGCSCGKCVASSHKEHCTMLKCSSDKGVSSCADCLELPCTNLIMHTFDPVWLSHASCIESLRRRKSLVI